MPAENRQLLTECEVLERQIRPLPECGKSQRESSRRMARIMGGSVEAQDRESQRIQRGQRCDEGQVQAGCSALNPSPSCARPDAAGIFGCSQNG